MAGPVVLPSDEFVGNDVMEPRIGVEPSGAVERNPAGPAVIARYRRIRRHVSVVMDDVVIGGQIVAANGGDFRSAGVCNGVVYESKVARRTAEGAVCSVSSNNGVEPTELATGSVGGD